jgi:PHD/YefM family antitoxin component YafN of YafNO toxin-antitoxin module
MAKKNKAEKTANSILIEAGTQIAKFSFNTAKNIFSLYKNAGFEAVKQSKKLLSETVRLTLDNQKNVVKTSNKAFKETVEVIREQRNAEKNEAIKNRKAATEEMTIDDLLAA